MEKEIQKAAEDYPVKSNFGYVEIGWTEIRNYEIAAFKAGAKFAASLQTPSNDYWRERCEAAELNTATYSEWQDEADGDDAQEYYHRWQEALKKWQALKSTPIPIQTPYVELEKEVERLKGLISVALTTDPPRTIDEINKFKTEYNL